MPSATQNLDILTAVERAAIATAAPTSTNPFLMADDYVYCTLTAAAEAADAIAVTVQFKDGTGTNVTSAVRAVATLAAAGNCSLSETGAGAQVGPTQAAAPLVQMVFDTSAAGVAVVTCTDDTTALAGTMVLTVTPVNAVGRPTVLVLTFA